MLLMSNRLLCKLLVRKAVGLSTRQALMMVELIMSMASGLRICDMLLVLMMMTSDERVVSLDTGFECRDPSQEMVVVLLAREKNLLVVRRARANTETADDKRNHRQRANPNKRQDHTRSTELSAARATFLLSSSIMLRGGSARALVEVVGGGGCASS